MPGELRSILGSLIGVLPCLLVQSARAQGVDLFRTTPTFDVGEGPAAIVTCDLNQDGRPDVVTANELFDDIAVLLNDGAGGFFTQVRFGVGPTPVDLVCVDLDNDGKLDVATVNAGDWPVTILRGNGDGTFAVETARLQFDFYSDPTALAVGRLDGDDSIDIVVVSVSDMAFLFGPPNFGSPPVYDIIVEYGGADVVAIADVDDDHINDLVTARRLFWGIGDGRFLRTNLQNTYESSVTTANIDNDAHLDLLLSGPSRINLFRGLGSRTFAAATQIEIGLRLSQAAVADLDGDARLDILTTNEAANDDHPTGSVRRRSRLDGILSFYYREAA